MMKINMLTMVNCRCIYYELLSHSKLSNQHELKISIDYE